MLGKRPHQIQRTSSMAQLRVPPGARARARPLAREFTPQRPRKPVDLTHQETLRLDVAEPPHVTASLHADALPSIHVHTPDYLKKPTAPLPGLSSSSPSWMPSPLLNKHTTSESFMDACYSCQKPLGHGRDIFMYRGDAAFCSEDCRFRQITHDERRQKCSVSASPETSKTATIPASSGAL